MVMDTDETLGDETQGGEGAGAKPVEDKAPIEVPAERKALVKRWLDRIKDAESHWEEKAFKRMRVCMKLAKDGTTDAADAAGEGGNTSYVVPVLSRVVNQAVATLYAKNPTAVAKRKAKLLYTLWDGDPRSLDAAMMQVAQPPLAPVTDEMGQPVVDQMGQPALAPQPDPNALALLQEIDEVKKTIILYDRMAKTMQLLFRYFLEEQDAGYKEQFKQLVRRVKTCGVGYVKLGFQRTMRQDPDVAAKIADATSKIKAIESAMARAKAGEIEQESAELEELRLNIEDLTNSLEVIVREGPVLSFPFSTRVFPDKKCRDLKTFSGSRFIVESFDLDPLEIMESYGKDVGENYTGYVDSKAMKTGDDKSKGCCRVYRVQDKRNQQEFAVCDGYPDFLLEPSTPDVEIERFWTIYALVFNGVESEDNPYPNSDVWNARHMQREYNSSRQGLREHKIAARPRWGTQKGKLEQADKDKLAGSVPFEVLEFNSMAPGETMADLLSVVPVPGVDPNLYETESTFNDIQRSVGFQEANLGGTSGDTATESSIAENSRSAAAGSDVDDLDTMLSALARGMGQLMLLNLSKDTVIEIAGPGAVWPDAPPTREQVVKDLILEIEAGSSGRPNKAADSANLERAMPWVTMLPGMNPKPWGKKFLDLHDIDIEEGYVEGLPSITAVNQMAGSAQAGAGPNDPNKQGDKGEEGGSGMPKDQQQNEPQSQPEYTPPGTGMPPA